MSKPILAGLAAAAATIVCAVAALAQSSSLPLPPGSWRDSCGDARAYSQNGGKVLTARCTKAGGGTEISSLRYDQCRGDIANRNGRLVCGNPGPLPPRPPVATPDGSYRQSCRNAVMISGRLHAECRDRGGAWNHTSIDPAQCRGRDIANDDGRLTCAGGGGGALPEGSYRQSCRDARLVNGTLFADCRDSRGYWQRASIDPRSCSGRDIANRNGRLVCAGGDSQLPPGSWRASCDQAYMSGWTLNAVCRDSRGQRVRTSINTRTCNGRDIANVNGRLTCGGGGGGGASITLCTQPNFGGRCATINRAAPSLGQWEMANRAASARVNGRWLICDQQDYRGRCVTLDRDERDLNRVSFSRRISSVRPTR
ncbi:MAG TPA: CVNH domain-containing protein [Caulobacter sp.]|nr:CVNH domain-containing protein [Caulobacter sp.]